MKTKACFKCGKLLPLDDFYAHPMMKDGHLNKCKECTKKDNTRNRNKNIERYRAYDRERGARQTPEYQKKYRLKNPQRQRALRVTAYAIQSGKLFKEPCEVCGTEESVHAHHDDYAKPLNVRWLCAAHHSQWHRDNGEGKNP